MSDPTTKKLLHQRPFATALPSALLASLQSGVMTTRYRGVPCYKSPFDLVLYSQLLDRLRPRTVIEIGTKYGGSALWFADAMGVRGISSGRVVSIDCEQLVTFADDRIDFLRGLAQNLAEVLDGARLAACPKPWLVVEDSSHLFDDVSSVLEFFDDHLTVGDYIVVEDGILSQFLGSSYDRYENGPNRAVAAFLEAHSDYAIDVELCDHFGYNVTYSPNAWLRRSDGPTGL